MSAFKDSSQPLCFALHNTVLGSSSYYMFVVIPFSLHKYSLYLCQVGLLILSQKCSVSFLLPCLHLSYSLWFICPLLSPHLSNPTYPSKPSGPTPWWNLPEVLLPSLISFPCEPQNHKEKFNYCTNPQLSHLCLKLCWMTFEDHKHDL